MSEVADLGALDAAREEIEVDLLLEALYRHYGIDFRGYARASLRRRLWRRATLEGVTTLSGLQERVLHDESCTERLLLDLSVNVTSMFRDPPFYAALRREVVPLLRTHPFVRIWNAGCSTGEETWSLAIVLEEEGLYDRTRIYATDMNEAVLAQARTGLFPLDRMQAFTEGYHASGGRRAFSEHYVAGYEGAQFDRRLAENMVFARHNLASDAGFNEFQLIVCRNVMIYFGATLQDRVHDLFHASLERSGVLALGPKESLAFTSHADDYQALDVEQRLYRKVR